MKNKSLTKDYIERSIIRLEALKILFERGGYADVVRESQEIVELVCKALIRHLGAEPARVHDVSSQIKELRGRLDPSLAEGAQRLIDISRELRRDRELAFYGTEDLTPSEFYSKKDAKKAMEQAKTAVAFVGPIVCP